MDLVLAEGMLMEMQLEDEKVVVFGHGPDCTCGAQFVLPRFVWEGMGQPRLILTAAIPMDDPILGDNPVI